MEVTVYVVTYVHFYVNMALVSLSFPILFFLFMAKLMI